LPEVLKKFHAHAQGRLRISENVPLLRKDGQIVYADVACNGTFEYAGRRCVVASFRDATHRKKAEEAARQREIEWERTFDAVPDLIAILDSSHRIVQINRAMAEQLGCWPDRCIGQLCHQVVHGCTHPPELCPFTLSLADGKTHTAEFHEERLGGDFLVSTTPLSDEAGNVVGSVHVCRDITEQKKTRQALRHLVDAGDREQHLISCEIHDGLAQQLAAAMMHLSAFDRAKQQKNAPQAAQAYAMALKMLHGRACRSPAARRRAPTPAVREKGLVGAIEELVLAANHSGETAVELCSNVESVTLEPMLEHTIFRMVQECLANACKHSGSPKVRIDFLRREDQLRIEIQDWGAGFDPRHVPEGHFGLESIQQRAGIFGGRATISSTPGQGTHIVVELPLRGYEVA